MTEKMKFREKTLKTGTKIILGTNEASNDKLMNQFKGKSNVILHTVAPGSPFGVILKLRPTKEEVYVSGSCVARYSQDFRDNKTDIAVSVFTGKDISKAGISKPGMWNVKKSRKIKIKRKDIEKWQ